MKTPRIRALLILGILVSSLVSARDFVELPEFTVTDWVVANPEPAGTYSTPVSALRYEWQADLQSRNLAEAQGDLAIRGGVFHNSGFRIGNVSILDPQTGHYAAELPVSPQMLDDMKILTGFENALYGMNTSVGTVERQWSRIRERDSLFIGGGTDDLKRVEWYGGWEKNPDRTGWAADAGFAYSEGDGTRPDGDHEFARYTGRIQYRGERSQTDFFAGYQSKFFQWPNMYVLQPLHDLVGSRGIESENLQTQLWMLSHRQEMDNGRWNGAFFYRRNRDDYEFDIDRPGLFNAFQHTTEVTGGSLEGAVTLREQLGVRGSVQFMKDSIDSTSLTFGEFDNRNILHATVTPEWRWRTPNGDQWRLAAGGTLDWSNRHSDALSPLLELAWSRRNSPESLLRTYFSFSESTQVPSYTALASNPDGGLFRGNPDLGRERSRNFEIGFSGKWGNTSLRSAVFHRRDKDLVDWIFEETEGSFSSRFAENVDLDTTGVELVLEYVRRSLETRLGYTYLVKDEDFERDNVVGSFYALNFPTHRTTLGLVWRPLPNLQVRLDQEWRLQEENPLRNGRDSAILGQLGVVWKPLEHWPVDVSVHLENMWDVEFEQIPGVPGNRRQLFVGLHLTDILPRRFGNSSL